MDSSLEKLIVFKYAECCKFPVQGDWNSKNSQNLQSLFFPKKRWIFQNKTWFPYKLLKVAELKWNASEKSKTSKNVQVLRCFWNRDVFFDFFFSFSKLGRCSKLLLNATKTAGHLNTFKSWVFSETETGSWIFFSFWKFAECSKIAEEG